MADNKTANDLMVIAQDFYAEGEMNQAEDALDQAIEMAQASDDHEGLVALLNLLAGVYRATDRMEDALTVCLQAIEHSEQIASMLPLHIGYLYDNVGQILMNLGRPTEALPHYQTALERILEDDDPDYRTASKSFAIVAQIHELLGNHAESEICLKRCAECATKSKDWDQIANAASIYAVHLLETNRSQEAHDFLQPIIDGYQDLMGEPLESQSVFDPEAMAFELLKEDFRDSKTVSFAFAMLLVIQSRLNNELGIDDRIPETLPGLSAFQVDMLAETFGLAERYLNLAVQLHLLAQEASRDSAYKETERLYRLAYQTAKSDDSTTESYITSFCETIRENLQELYEDTGRIGVDLDL